MTVVADVYLYDCKGEQQVLVSPVVHQGQSSVPSLFLIAFDKMARSTFL